MTSSKPLPPCVISCLAALLMLAATDHHYMIELLK